MNINSWPLRRKLLTELTVVALCSAAIIYIFYPGFMSYDSIQQLRFAKSGDIPDAHPPLMSMIWGALDRIVEGPALMLFLQVGIFSLSLFLISRSLVETAPRARWLAYLPLIFPPVLGISGIIWKDVLMHTFLTLGLAISLWLPRQDKKRRIILLITVLGCYLLAASMRHNAIFAVAPLTIALFLLPPSTKNLTSPRCLAAATACAAFSVVAIISVNHVVTKATASRAMHFSQVLMAFDIAGTSVHAGSNLFRPDYEELLARPITLNDLEQRHSSRYYACLYKQCDDRDPLIRYMRNERDLKKLQGNWISTIVGFPVEWMQHKAQVAVEILNLPGAGGLWGPTLRTPIEDNPWGIQYNETPLRKYFRETIFSISRTPIYNAYIYFFYSIALFLITIILISLKAIRKDMSIASLATLSSGLFYEFSLFLGAASSDFRYSIWLIICSLLGSTFVISGIVRK